VEFDDHDVFVSYDLFLPSRFMRDQFSSPRGHPSSCTLATGGRFDQDGNVIEPVLCPAIEQSLSPPFTNNNSHPESPSAKTQENKGQSPGGGA